MEKVSRLSECLPPISALDQSGPRPAVQPAITVADTTPPLSHAAPADVLAVRSMVVADGLMTVAEACKFLSLGRTTLYAAMECGDLAYCRRGRARRIPRRAVIAY